MDQDLIRKMPAEAACEGEPFAFAPESEQVGDAVGMLDADDFLIDDRAGIELGGDIMAGRADQFDTARVRFLIRVRADEAWEKGMMDVDDPSGHRVTERGRNDLHVAREHDQIGAGFLPNRGDLLEGGVFVFGAHGNAMERHAFALDLRAQRFVISDHAGELERELSGAPAPEQIGETMAEGGNHEDDAQPGLGRAQCPFGAELFREGPEGIAQCGQFFAKRGGINLHAAKKPTRLGIGKLMNRDQVSAMRRDPAGDAGEQADLIWTTQFQKGGHEEKDEG